MRVAVIGGGPAGLVTLKQLLEVQQSFQTEPIEVWLFEKEVLVGGTFRYRTYEDGELVSSRFLTSFSDFRLSDENPDFISTDAYCEYLENYCTHFNLWQNIRLETTVHRIQRNRNGGHRITFSKRNSTTEDEWHCDAIAVCSGLNVTPNIPNLSGLEYIPEVFHSSRFKTRKEFGIDKNIVILGAGETAMDIAYLAITSPTKSVTLCHRGGWKNEPKKLPDLIYSQCITKWAKDIELNGISPPADTSFASLFDTAYVHPALERSLWQWEYYDKYTWFYSWYTTGAGTGIDQFVGEIQGERHHARKAVANKSNRTQAYISAPYRPKHPSIIEKIRAYLVSLPKQDTNDRVVNIAPWPHYFDKEGFLHFQDNGRVEYQTMKDLPLKPDILIYATGYTQVFPFFDESYPTIFDADIRRIWKAGVEDVGFIGFVRPSFGAIPPLAELQAQLWITNLFGRLPRAIEVVENYLLQPDKDRRLDYIVDHETYTYRLACDIGAAPSILQVLAFGPTVFLSWALGANYNTKFRLVGPWKWDGAASVMEGELWRVTKRRKGFIIWTFLTILPITLFGFLSLLYFIVYGVKDIIQWLLIPSGLWEQEKQMELFRGQDPTGMKREQALEDARGPEKVSS